MKILLQHPHEAGVISGVHTYCEAAREALAPRGIEAQIFSTHGASVRALWRAVREADLVHLNSNHLRLVLFARLQRKPVLIKYHYPFWDELFAGPPVRRGVLRRLARDMIFNWRQSMPDGFGRRRQYYNTSRFVRGLLRVTVAFLVDVRLGCSEFIARSTDLPLKVETDYNLATFPVRPPEAVNVQEGNGHGATFAFVGRLDAMKGVDVLLQAAAALAQRGLAPRVEIVGDGAEGTALRALEEKLGLEECVTFHGRWRLSRRRGLWSCDRGGTIRRRT